VVETVPAARVTLSGMGTIYGHAIADASGMATLILTDPPSQPMDLTLTITAYNKVTHLGTVQVLPSAGSYILVEDMVITDDNNNIPEFGETITLNINLNNVGNATATGVSVSISTTSPYLTILNSIETIPDILANSLGGTVNGFNIQIAANVPDQHIAPIHIVIETNDGMYEYNRSFTINAPAFTWGSIVVVDFLGNNNGLIDPGETVTLNIPITNSGHAQANDIITALVINNVTHVATPEQTYFTALPPGAQVNMIYTVTFSSQIPAGTVATMNVMLFSGQYSSTHLYSMNLGIVIENFDAGFDNFPWQFTGGNWTTENTSYNNTNCARSATITHNQTTSMSITMDVPATGTISFWKKVSSEQNYDYLRFYINGVLKNQWSGTTDVWSQVSYDVFAGTNIFKWEYYKDSVVSSGDDCAWIDDVIFPTTGGTSGTPAIALDISQIDFGYVPLNETSIMPVTINNTGDAVLIGTVTVEAPFALQQGNCPPNPSMNIVVPAESFLQIEVLFTPTAQIDYQGTLFIDCDDPSNPQVSLQLAGSGMIVSNDDPVLPVITELQGNYPNPFNPETTIRYSLKESVPVVIEIYNVKGQLVKTLVNEAKAAGNHSVVWNGRDNQNRPVSSGIFFYKMHAGKYSNTKKMILMK